MTFSPPWRWHHSLENPIEIRYDGIEKQLPFSTTIVNVGAEPFIVTGRRPDTNTADMNTTQRIYDPAGDYRDEPTTATLFYSSDGHDHWQHVRDLEDYDLLRIDESGNVVEPEYVVVGQIEKIGFWFFDNTEYGSSEPRYCTGCEGGNPGALGAMMDPSRGWGDTYGSNTRGQCLDITDVPNGQYRLRVKADGDSADGSPAGRFLESDESNNFTW